MINVSNWDEIRAHYEDYWNLRNKTPVVYLAAPREGGSYDYEEPTSEQFWFDPKWNAGANRHSYENTFYALDGYPYVSPSLGPYTLSGLLGQEIVYNETSSWIRHWDRPLSEITDFSYREDNFYLKKMEEFLRYYTEDAKNVDYIVGTSDLNCMYDGVAALIGAESLCYEMMDSPDDVKQVVKGYNDLFKQIYRRFTAIVTKYQRGTTNWLGVYSDIPWYYISNDFMVMISRASFDEFVAEPLRDLAAFIGRVLFHLDGENMTYHLDSLLQMKELTGIQVQATPAVQSTKFWIPYLKRIQEAGKCFWIEARNADEVQELMENLRPEGMFIKTWAESEAEARELEARVKRFYR